MSRATTHCIPLATRRHIPGRLLLALAGLWLCGISAITLRAGDTSDEQLAPTPAPAVTTQEEVESAPSNSYLPASLDPENDFSTLTNNSPFLRSLDLSSSLSLVGVARIGNDPMVVLYDRESKETQVVSSAEVTQGLRLVGVEGSQTDLKSMTAQIRSPGGEIFSVRFDEMQLKPEERRGSSGRGGGFDPRNRGGDSRRPEDFRNGISGDGFRGPPPPELVKKLEQMSEDRRNAVIQEMARLRDRGVSSEERQQIFTRLVERASR